MTTTPDLPAAAVGSFLTALRTLPVWLLGGLALAGYVVLFAPAFGNVDAAGFRTAWGIWAWVWALVFSTLALARSIDAAVSRYLLHRKTIEAHRVLRLVQSDHQSWWHLAKQQDDSFVSQISLDIEAINLTDRPVRIIKARLIRPRVKGEALIQAMVTLPMKGSPYHDDKHPVPPHDTVTASLHVMVRGRLAPQGTPLRVTLGITDQFGYEHRLKGIVIRTHDLNPPKLPWKARLASVFGNLRAMRRRPKAESDRTLPPPPDWQHQGKFEEADLILHEERRNYAACGRIRGGLGSLNVGLQSEPNLGWTTVGSVPALLWDKDHAKTIGSSNTARLLKLYVALDAPGRADLERYLLSHLHKGSPFSDIAYFIFLALHRMGRTVDAIQAARASLAGDKVFGYSNLLGMLSAIVSHEHFTIEPAFYPRILEALAGDTEHNFRLPEKINLARLQHLDTKLK